MDDLPKKFVPESDQKDAALANKKLPEVSLSPLLAVGGRPQTTEGLPKIGLDQHQLTHLEFGEYEGQQISEETLMSLLRECDRLELLDLSGCNGLFLSGRLLSKESDIKILRHNLASVRVLKLNRLKHITDVTFERLVSVMDNVEEISLASVNMIFGAGLYKVNQCSPAMLHFSTFLKFAQWRVDKLKAVDLSYTSINDEALICLAMTQHLVLDSIILKGCMQISDKGLRLLVSYQHCLKNLDISESKELGKIPDLFRLLANNLPYLHSLTMRKCVNIGQSDVPAMCGMKSLRYLDMGEVPRFLDRDLIRGLCCSSINLTSLSLSSCPDVSDDFIVELSKTGSNLMHLDLSSCTKLTDASLHAITWSMTSLQTLRLNSCREISDVGVLGYIPEKGVVPRFTFDFDHDACPCMRERDSTVFRKPLGAVKEHKTCQSKAHFSAMKGEDLYMLSNLKFLQELDLSYCPRITDVALVEALKFKDLRSLTLIGLPRINDRSIQAIANHNPNLESVILSKNGMISNTAVVELLIHCPQLYFLDISQCGSLDDGLLKGIAAYSKMLQHLDISFNKMTLKAVSQLQSSIPNTKIVFKPQFD